MKGEVGGGCGEAAGAPSGEGASGEAGDADTPAPAPPGGEVRPNGPPPSCGLIRVRLWLSTHTP